MFLNVKGHCLYLCIAWDVHRSRTSGKYTVSLLPYCFKISVQYGSTKKSVDDNFSFCMSSLKHRSEFISTSVFLSLIVCDVQACLETGNVGQAATGSSGSAERHVSDSAHRAHRLHPSGKSVSESWS